MSFAEVDAGPSLRSSAERVPDALAESIVAYEHGARKRVREFWTNQGSLFVFLRHFACPGCSEQVAILTPFLPELRREHTRVVLVATSAPNRIPTFAKRMHLESGLVEVVTDPTLATHKAAGLVRSVSSMMNFTTVAEAVRLYAQGHFGERDPDDGDVFQQGGAMLVDREGAVLFRHTNRHMTDHFSMEQVCDVLGGSRGSTATARF